MIGLLTNLLGIALYLFTDLFFGMPKLTMTAMYSADASISFFANRRVTFRHDARTGDAGIRYLVAQQIGYLLNLTLLVLFVDRQGFVHQFVQAVVIVAAAIFSFVLSLFFVFAPQLSKNRAIRS